MKLPLPKPPSHLVKQRKPAKSNKSNIQAQLDVLLKQFHQLRSAGRHADALLSAQKAHQLIPNKYKTIIEQDNTLMGKIPRIYARGIPTGETRIYFKKT